MSEKRPWSENEKLLVAGVAWAQCYNVNPSNPLAVAQHIGEMVKALKGIKDERMECHETEAAYVPPEIEAVYNVLSAISGIIRTIESKETK